MATSVLQTASGDIAVGTDGTQRWTSTLSEETEQRLRQKYRLFRGEWFLDSRAGVPYWDILGAKPARPEAARAILRKVAALDPAVAVVDVFTATLDTATRRLTIVCTVRLIDGEVLELEPFVI
jgi:hypothetical protein